MRCRILPVGTLPFLLAFTYLHPVAAVGGDLPTITWDVGTLRLVARGGSYARMVRLPDSSIACVYDSGPRVWLRHSSDDGFRWGEPILVAEDSGCWLANADLLPLQDGTLLYFWNERPRAAVDAHHRGIRSGPLKRPFLIRMARSYDLGHTWSRPQTLYTAGPSYDDGCWEPCGIQLPSGEIHVYFANEFPFKETPEQEIALLRSRDGGRSWSDAERVGFRCNHRDGMPVPLLLAGNRGIALAIEDNGLAGGRFKPAILHTTMEDLWRSGPVEGDSPKRWSALAEPLEPQWYGGAPFLARLPSGHTLLSYQESSDGRLERCRMAVCVGDANARRFTHKTYPLALGPRGNQAWNSIFVKNATTVTAVLSTIVEGVHGVWAVDGRVEPAGRDRR